VGFRTCSGDLSRCRAPPAEKWLLLPRSCPAGSSRCGCCKRETGCGQRRASGGFRSHRTARGRACGALGAPAQGRAPCMRHPPQHLIACSAPLIAPPAPLAQETQRLLSEPGAWQCLLASCGAAQRSARAWHRRERSAAPPHVACLFQKGVCSTCRPAATDGDAGAPARRPAPPAQPQRPPLTRPTSPALPSPAPGISASPSEDNLRYFNVLILGPVSSPYEGGAFKLELFLPEDYPMAPPKVRGHRGLHGGAGAGAGGSH
jgi:hypothetical protein